MPSPDVTPSFHFWQRHVTAFGLACLHVLLDLLFPRRCVVCSVPGATLCAACASALPRLAAPLCARCGAPTAWPVQRCRECSGRRIAFATARAAVAYEVGVRLLVSAWKERGLRDVGSLAAELIIEAVPRPSARAITFVPPDGDRSLRRGHHPPARLAREIGRRWELPVQPLLERTRPLRPQRGLGRDERRQNVRGAFRARAAPSGLVILVDDVYTTGATVSAAASALRKAGTASVDVITFARTVRR